MFSPNQIYDYLRYYMYSNKKNAVVRNFTPDGSKILNNLAPSQSPLTPHDIKIENIEEYDISNEKYRLNNGCIDMYEQEPIDIHAFYNSTTKLMNPNAFRMSLGINDFVFSNSMGVYDPILCHSEKNSIDVNEFFNNFFIPFHYWSNAFTSRHWFSHYEMLDNINIDRKHRFGVYIRDTGGTRKYRSDIIDFIQNTKTDIFCPMLDGGVTTKSCASASIDWLDHTKFDIHLVAETIFNTEKTHLTEKVFKPIVMYQPFILFAGANSLKYMHEYGFKSFGDIWDESYDAEPNADKRFNKIISLIDKISKLTPNEYNALINQTKSIVEYNRKHFYSDKFKNILLSEFKDGLETAINTQEENFYTHPGGTLFHYCNMYDRKNREYEFKKYITPSLHEALLYIKSKSESVANETIKKYSHLL